MKRYARLAVAVCLAAICGPTAWAQPAPERRLVLVASADASIGNISPAEVRRLYLGLRVTAADGSPILPLVNRSDPFLQEVFLQKVMFLSAPAYERALLANLLRAGAVRPVEIDSRKTLLEALRAQRNAVTCLWAEDAEATPALKIVTELWRERR